MKRSVLAALPIALLTIVFILAGIIHHMAEDGLDKLQNWMDAK